MSWYIWMILLIEGNDYDAISRFKGYLSECFRMKDLRNAKYFLGIEVAKSSKGIYLSQTKYALDVISESGYLAGKHVIEKNHQQKVEDDDAYTDPVQYR